MSKASRRSAAVAAIVAATPAAVIAEQETFNAPVVATEGTHKSIRSLIMAGITVGRSTKEIAADVQAQFPNTQAAAKSTKHIAWYRSRMKKDAKAAADKAALLAKIDEQTAS